METASAVRRGFADRVAVKDATLRVPDDTLVPLLKDDVVPMETLVQRYRPLLEFVKVLIGVMPKCDTYLEIWPPAFRTYNVLVPNLFNLPFAVFGVGSAPKAEVGLAAYVASRAAECPYCSAHTCSYALRRGAALETVAAALDPGRTFTPREQATIAVARSLARIPCELVDAERAALEAQFGRDAAQWVVYGAVMMGFLNKFMDAVGVELEPTTVAEVHTTMGPDWRAGKADADLPDRLESAPPPPADSLRTKLGLIPHLPGALRLDAQWQRGVPDRWPQVGAYLTERVGHDFPVLSRLRARRVIRAIATAIRDNLDPATTEVGLSAKAQAGLIFCAVVQDASLAADVAAVARAQGIDDETIQVVRAYGLDESMRPPGADEKTQAILQLARAASPSPARITADVVGACRQARLAAAEIVELVAWLSVLQLLHRLSSYFRA